MQTTPIEYPPLHPPKPAYDPSTSVYWPYYTAQERQMALNHPRDEVALEIQLMRSEIVQVLKAQQKDPCKTPQESLSILYAISVASRTIGTLVKFQSDYKKTHSKWAAFLEEAHHIAFIRTGNYRLMAKMGFAVPDGVLEIEPDLLPRPTYIPGWTKEQSEEVSLSNETGG
ncbi:MAG: hypothetical protein ABIJ65_02560 [Chloroflexota bacterium]